MLTEVELAEYDVKKFPFRSWFAEVLSCEELETLHSLNGVTTESYYEAVTSLRAICETRIEELHPYIQEFFDAVVEPKFGRVLSWQRIPTVRTHFAVSDAVLDIERHDFLTLGAEKFLVKHYFDSYRPAMFHRDRDYGLTAGSINLWVPVTDAFGTNSLWIGGTLLRGRDALPVEVAEGDCIFFDGANRWHGVVWNTSGATRVSFDIRFLPESAAG